VGVDAALRAHDGIAAHHDDDPVTPQGVRVWLAGSGPGRSHPPRSTGSQKPRADQHPAGGGGSQHLPSGQPEPLLAFAKAVRRVLVARPSCAFHDAHSLAIPARPTSPSAP